MKLANRRIRLVLAIFVFAFAAMFVRAAWLQGVRAGSYERLASGQHKATRVNPAGRGAIFDRTGVQLAIGRQATTVYANPRQIRDPESTASPRREDAQARPGTGAARARRPVARFRLHRAQGRPGAGGEAEGGRDRRPRLRRRGTARVPAHACRVTGARIRGNRQPRPRRARARPREGPRRQGRERDDHPGPDRPRDRHPLLDGRGRGPERHAHARPHDPGAGGGGAAEDDRPLATRTAPRRSCSTRARAASSRWRSSAATTRTASRSCPRTASATGP